MIPKTHVIVLKKYNYRETSIIATFYSKEFGKIRCLLKGVRKDPKKFATNLNIFSHNELIFYKKNNSDLHLAGQCDLIKDFCGIYGDFRKSAMASYIIELIDSVMQIEDKNEGIFELLLNALDSINANAVNLDKIVHFFEIKLLILSGFKPHFDSCIVCNKQVSQKAHFSLRLGGLVCGGCIDRDRQSHDIMPGTIASIMHVENSDWRKALNLNLSNNIQQELRSILFNFLSMHLDKKIKSYRFIHSEV